MTNLNDLSGYSAILGGSFDPIHLGHLHIARQILELSPISSVIFMPNNKHHFKSNTGRLPFEKRVLLMAKALQEMPNCELWLDDACGTGYTDDLMRGIYAKHPSRRFCFVIGSDIASTLPNWHNYEWLKTNLSFLIIPRPGADLELLGLSELDYCILETEPCPISSTRIRELIGLGESIRGLVSPTIEADIYNYYRELYEAR